MSLSCSTAWGLRRPARCLVPIFVASTTRSASSCPSGRPSRPRFGALPTPTRMLTTTATHPARSTSHTGPGIAGAVAQKEAPMTPPCAWIVVLFRRWISWLRLASPPDARRTVRARAPVGYRPSHPPGRIGRHRGDHHRGCSSATDTSRGGRVPCWRRPGRWRNCGSSTVVCGGGRSLTSSISVGTAAG